MAYYFVLSRSVAAVATSGTQLTKTARWKLVNEVSSASRRMQVSSLMFLCEKSGLL